MVQILFPPSQNALQKTLDAQLDAGHTTALTLNNVTGIQNKPGVLVINRINTAGSLLEASRREYIQYTAVSGSTLTGLTRGLAGSSDQEHGIGSVVEFISDVVQAQSIIDAITAEHAEDGTHTDITADSIDIGGTIAITGVLDEDTMSSDSAVKLATQQSIKAYVDTEVAGISLGTDGWTAGDAMTYVSAQSVSVTGDKTATYTPGTRIKLTNDGGTDYYVVKSSAYSSVTTITFITSTDYALANSAITNPFYSYEANPQGWPSWFNYTPTTAAVGGGSFTPSFRTARFAVIGRTCHVVWVTAGHTISGTVTSVTITLPTNDAAESSNGYEMGVGGFSLTSAQFIRLVSSDGTKYSLIPTSGNWAAAAANGYFGAKFFYQI